MRKSEIVVVCFGAPSIAGDALGPKIGSILSDSLSVPFFVYGTLSRPITAKNMDEYLSFIRTAHRDAVMLAVDASLGEENRVGKYTVRTDGVCPAAVGGKKKRVGDVGFLGVVGSSEGDHLAELMSTNEIYVSKLADKMAFAIKCALDEVVLRDTVCF